MRIGRLLLLSALLVAGCQRGGTSRTAEEALREGWSEFRLNEFAEAEGSFREALEGVSGEDARAVHLRTNATYGLALLASLWHHGEDPGKGRGLFEQVIRMSPQSEEATWAGLAVIRDEQVTGAFGSGELSGAERRYAEFVASHPHTAAADEAFVDEMALRVQTMKGEEELGAIGEIENYLRENRETRMKAALCHLLSKAYEVRGDYPRALAAAIAALDAKERNPENPTQNNIPDYYRIGMMAQYDVGDFATARKYYGLFLKEYPRDLRAFNVKRMMQHLEATEGALRAGREVPGIAGLPPTETGGVR